MSWKHPLFFLFVTVGGRSGETKGVGSTATAKVDLQANAADMRLASVGFDILFYT